MSFFTHIKRQYNVDTCTLLKRYCRTIEKMGKQTERLKYLLTCRKRSLIPKHLENTTRSTRQLFTSTRISRELDKVEGKFHLKMLNLEIKETNYNLNDLRGKIGKMRQLIAQSISKREFEDFMTRQKSRYNRITMVNRKSHLLKIEKLKREKLAEYNITFNSDWFVNNTTINIPDDSKWLLSLGSKFALPINNKNFGTIGLIADLEQWVQTLTNEREKDITRSMIANRIMTHKRTIRNDGKEKFILGIYEDTRRFLRQYKDEIVITKADKGNKTVLMYKKDYDDGMNKLLKDKHTYKRILIDPTQKLQKTNNNIIMDLYKGKYINGYEKKILTANAATAPRLYGLPKIHKPNNPLRPISSSVGVPCYGLSKYIGNILKNIILDKFNIKNSLELKTKLDTLILDEDEILVSLDVVSLFTNIPIHLAISNIMTKWNMLQNHTKIPRSQFLKILKFCLNDNNYFMHDGKLYQQTYGMPMGNPLSPTVADIILDHLMEQCIEELEMNNIRIRLITKYVDDLFAIIKYKDEDIILRTFNSYHNKLKFTLEREKDNAIPYLDMKIIRQNDRIITDWYMKPIASGRLMNFHSTQPMKQKINTAMNLIHKVLKISDVKFQDRNMTRIKDILMKNNFPKGLITSLITKVDDNISSGERNKNDTSGNAKYYSLPFIPRLTENNKLREIINDEQTIFAHKANKTIHNLFTQTKTKIECRDQSNVVYQIECDGDDNGKCGKIYIGTTKRNLGVRIDEHRADIKRGKHSTALSQHCIENGHKPNFERVRILDKEKRENKRYTLESLRIQQKSTNAINTKEDKDNTNANYIIAIL